MQVRINQLQYRWVVLIIVWMSYLTAYWARLGIGPMAPFLKEAFNLSNSQVGTLASASVITHAPTLIIGGWLVDRIGVHRMLINGTLITTLCFMALFFAFSYQFMLIAIVLSGLGTGCIFPSTVKAIILWFSPKERGAAQGFNQTAINVSGLIGACLFPPIAVTLGWRYSFLFMSFGVLAICLCCALFYHDPPQNTIVVTTGDSQNGSFPKTFITGSLLELLKSRDIWMISLAGLFLAIVEFAIITHLLVFLKEDLFFGAVTAGSLLGMSEASGAIGKPASGLASDRLFNGHRKPVFLIMGSASSIMCLVIGIFSKDLGWLLYPVLIILGLTAIGWGGLYATLASEIGGRELAGVTSGTSGAILVFGIIIGPPLIGHIADRTGSFQTAWLAMALSGIISVVFTSFIREHKKNSLDNTLNNKCPFSYITGNK